MTNGRKHGSATTARFSATATDGSDRLRSTYIMPFHRTHSSLIRKLPMKAWRSCFLHGRRDFLTHAKRIRPLLLRFPPLLPEPEATAIHAAFFSARFSRTWVQKPRCLFRANTVTQCSAPMFRKLTRVRTPAWPQAVLHFFSVKQPRKA